MAVYSIDYDLHKHPDEYPELFAAIKSLGPWCHALESHWMVMAEGTDSSSILNRLKRHITGRDKMLISKLTGQMAWVGLSDDISSWIQST